MYPQVGAQINVDPAVHQIAEPSAAKKHRGGDAMAGRAEGGGGGQAKNRGKQEASKNGKKGEGKTEKGTQELQSP